MNLRNFIKNHRLAVVFSILAGLVMVGPQLVFIRTLGSNYHGIYMLGTDAETHYLARMEELYDGHFWGNPFLAEFKGKQYSPFWTPIELLLAIPGYIFGIGIADLNLIYKFILPAVIFLLSYILVWRIVRDRWAGIAAGALITLGYNIMTAAGWLHLLKWDYIYSQFALYSRPINPEASVLIFLVFLNSCYSLWQKASWRGAILTGVIFGLSFYIYFFLWTFLSALIVLFLLVVIRDDRFKYFLGVFIVGLVIGIPALLFMAHVSQSSLFSPLAFVFGVMHNRSAHIGFLSIAVCFFLLLLWFKKVIDKSMLVFLSILMLTTVIVLVQNIVTNIKIQEGHYHWYFNVPIYAVIISVGLSKLLVKKPIIKNFFLGGLVVCSFLNGYLVQASSYYFNYPEYAPIQQAGPVFDWLSRYSVHDSIVLSNEQLSELIPIYTHNNVFWNAYAIFYLIPIETIEQRLFYLLKLNDYYGAVDDTAMKHDLVAMSLIKTEINAIYGGDIVMVYPPGLAQRYLNFLKNFKSAKIPYGPDYILIDQRTDHWNLSHIPVSLEFENGPYQLYHLK